MIDMSIAVLAGIKERSTKHVQVAGTPAMMDMPITVLTRIMGTIHRMRSARQRDIATWKLEWKTRNEMTGQNQ